ncbi:MAG: DMT family transporter [Pseudorhodobacter sp.]|nr:DMT family transporter [Pseudorhodobacter sp.]
MNQFTFPVSGALRGALYMVLAGVCFAAANAITYHITAPGDWGGLGFKAQSDTFWQYAIATLFSAPFILRHGLAGLKTQRPVLHAVRVVISALGVQAFVLAVAAQTPIWQIISLVMTSPIFVLVGAALFLGEKVSLPRWFAAGIGLAGATIVSGLWTSGLTWSMVYPLAAAVLWAGSSLMTKVLTRTESAPSITLWLLVLLTPINAGLSAQAGFELPSNQILGWLVIGGLIMMSAQYLLTWSYAAADAAFVQPFDDLKLISNILIYGIFFGYWPEGNIWGGVAMILSGTLYLLWSGRTVPNRAVLA